MPDYPKEIFVYAHWRGMDSATLMGILRVHVARGKEVFSFEYDRDWLYSGLAQELDPDLGLYSGPQYVHGNKINFGLFLDSSPDRWGRLLMRRREAAEARIENREVRTLYESDYLLGVFDGHRMGALRFKTDQDGEFLNADKRFSSPPWISISELEHASLQIEKEDIADDPNYYKWLSMLIAPGSSLGGARPKASVLDSNNELWIAKFPSLNDITDVGAWEMVTNKLAKGAGLNMAYGMLGQYSTKHHTYLTKRFDRDAKGNRIHFASALTMLSYMDGEDHSESASYLELANFLIRNGANVNEDLEELWKRIVFSICVSNTDDHLRNHGFILSKHGWSLSPAYDVNPNEDGAGLRLNITTDDNALELQLAMDVAEYFRLPGERARDLIHKIKSAVKNWRSVAKSFGIKKEELDIKSKAFSRADE